MRRFWIAILLASMPAIQPLTPAAAEAPAPATQSTVTSQQWAQDVDVLVERLKTLHPAPFKYVSEAEFSSRLAALKSSLPGLSRDQAVAGIMQLVALLGDGHTSIPIESLRRFGDHVLPLRFYLYSDGLHLQAADAQYSAALGGKLLSIDGMPAEEVVARLRPLISHDNEKTIDARLPGYLVIPEILAGVGVVSDPSADVRIVLSTGKKREQIDVKPVMLPALPEGHEDQFSYSSNWRDAAPSGSSSPAWQRLESKPYWFEYQPGSRTLFVQYNDCVSDAAEPIPAFARRLKGEIAKQKPARVVLDLRHNSGGEGYWNKFLLLALIKSDEIDQHGRLFVLIGRQTFSAASAFTADLERLTDATFVGEPTGGGVENFGNHQHVVLPNSQLGVMIATNYYQNTPFTNQRPWIAPQIATDPTERDYEAGIDPDLAAAIDYRPPVERLVQALMLVPASKAEAAYKSFRHDTANRYLGFGEVLIAAGYDRMKAGDMPRAIAAMRLATQENPRSANAFDSLGDAYKAAGRKADAIASYKKALSISPDWAPSIASLAELGVSSAAEHP